MAYKIHVNGPCLVSWGGNSLGYTTEGAEVEFVGHYEDVISDLMGPAIPTDSQQMGEEARITLDLVVYDAQTLNSALSREKTAKNDGNTAGTTPGANIGDLMAQCQKYGALVLAQNKTKPCNAAAEDDLGYTFPMAWVVDSYSKRIGTRATRVHVVFRAIPSPVEGNGIGLLYTRS